MSLNFEAVIFDLDGIVTDTARAHSKSWKMAFDSYLSSRRDKYNEPFKEFTHDIDYLGYVDGRPRYKGVENFLASRGIKIPFGDPSDPPEKETVCGIGNNKNKLFLELISKEGVEIFDSTVDFIKRLKERGIKVAVASSSKNCALILERTGLSELFQARVDGEVSLKLGLKGKPEGDIFVTAAYQLGVMPERCAVVEDAESGVAAGRNGAFTLVIGVARKDNSGPLFDNGADIVVNDVGQLSIDFINAWFNRVPACFFDSWDSRGVDLPAGSGMGPDKTNIQISPWHKKTSRNMFDSRKEKVFFLDYDGTLTPIVDRPEHAVMTQESREILSRFCGKYTTSIVSGRARSDVENLVAIDNIIYAGSHGFDISGPGVSMIEPRAEKVIPLIRKFVEEIKSGLGGIPGIIVEEKKFSVAVHWRLVPGEYLRRIEDFILSAVKGIDAVRLMRGKKVFEILPAVDWNKGKAILWITEILKMDWKNTLPVYIGDDTTDEDAFRILRTRGMGILVSPRERASAAHFRLSSPGEVRKLFQELISC